MIFGLTPIQLAIGGAAVVGGAVVYHKRAAISAAVSSSLTSTPNSPIAATPTMVYTPASSGPAVIIPDLVAPRNNQAPAGGSNTASQTTIAAQSNNALLGMMQDQLSGFGSTVGIEGPGSQQKTVTGATVSNFRAADSMAMTDQQDNADMARLQLSLAADQNVYNMANTTSMLQFLTAASNGQDLTVSSSDGTSYSVDAATKTYNPMDDPLATRAQKNAYGKYYAQLAKVQGKLDAGVKVTNADWSKLQNNAGLSGQVLPADVGTKYGQQLASNAKPAKAAPTPKTAAAKPATINKALPDTKSKYSGLTL